ncbi:MAG TPA: phenylalanine--tRNA ligase subunit alpha [SAR86 cluster bacterium]|nr:phenylalanine--tRNA ligase subunit alpha [SAR86 cluster bacterium]
MDLKSLKQQILKLQSESSELINSSANKDSLDKNYRSYLGKSGEVNLLLKSLGSLPQDKRKEAGALLNQLKSDIDNSYKDKTLQLSKAENALRLDSQRIDITLPSVSNEEGSMHPVTQTINEISSFFESVGFGVESGPETETDYYNFEALNVPEDHPAKDMHDTFYLKDSGLLRTHTSPVQIRTMENKKPPHRIICPGRVFRKDSDLTHTPMFHQIEGLVVEEGASFAQLKGLLNDFLEDFFGREVELRFRPSYFPFTEPSAEADIKWDKSWLEVLGCGMVHPNVLEMVGVDTKKYSGFAFGLGVERMAMLKHDIPDLRIFFENDYRFLKQF